jgi:hypothetical protein
MTIQELENKIKEENFPTTGETAVELWQVTASMYSDLPLKEAVKLMDRLGYEIWKGYPLQRKTYFLSKGA